MVPSDGLRHRGSDPDPEGEGASESGQPRLERQMGFVLEVDRLKGVLRQSLIRDASRRENDAEHTWHLALMALVLAEHAAGPVELGRVLAMLVVHDIVEIDAGDTYVYDDAAQATKAEREEAAARRIFGLLPPAQGARLRGLWEEFEARGTAEARFAAALDRLQPLLLNFHTGGATWKAHGVRRSQVIARNRAVADGAPELWAYAARLIDEAVARGYLADG